MWDVTPSVGLGILAKDPARAAGRWFIFVNPLTVCGVARPLGNGEAAETRGLAEPYKIPYNP